MARPSTKRKGKAEAAKRARQGLVSRSHTSPHPSVNLPEPIELLDSDSDGTDAVPNHSGSVEDNSGSDIELEPEETGANGPTITCTDSEWSDDDEDDEIEELTGNELLVSLEAQVVGELATLSKSTLYQKIVATRMTPKEWSKGPEHQPLGVRTGRAERTLREQKQKKAVKEKKDSETRKTYVPSWEHEPGRN